MALTFYFWLGLISINSVLLKPGSASFSKKTLLLGLFVLILARKSLISFAIWISAAGALNSALSSLYAVKRKYCFIVLLVRFVCLSVWGWYAIDKACFAPKSAFLRHFMVCYYVPKKSISQSFLDLKSLTTKSMVIFCYAFLGASNG
ncbi:hypothetical protein GGTG_10983 [Gaeumannomyces tritici R3-111a-1]|uniref:Uncharacterized protein n=1 Tax=Gaeumannomyces tritici (strain R3-111a-1) TaxID=644352 RepID=J3PBW1_GAET3|nr:hypothetical protein GGTG_10983 [Gaeumannomyces tritici R3-111a-1]EJT71729.1 hypothetical protein GGTG_10983 [Gaeumannomyces tritici R3-111a-1]